MPRQAKSSPLPGGKLNNFLNTVPKKNLYIAALVIGILLLAIYKKDWFVAAMVNGQPITNLELQQELNNRHRTNILNELIEKKVILDEARKNNAIPTDEEINQKISELETQVGGAEALDNLLSQQGQTRSLLRNTIILRTAIAKLYGNDATVSAEEVDKFVEENRENLQATDSASQEEETKETIKQQKIFQIFNEKFPTLKEAANIQIF